MTNPLDYEAPSRPIRILNVRVAVVAGIVGGVVAFASVFLLAYFVAFFAMVVGAFVAATVASRSPGFEYRAGLLANTVCTAVALLAAGIWLTFDHSTIEPLNALRVIPGWWAVFAVPGVLGSLWAWVGNRPNKLRDEIG
jgi:hypothetical protein